MRTFLQACEDRDANNGVPYSKSAWINRMRSPRRTGYWPFVEKQLLRKAGGEYYESLTEKDHGFEITMIKMVLDKLEEIKIQKSGHLRRFKVEIRDFVKADHEWASEHPEEMAAMQDDVSKSPTPRTMEEFDESMSALTW